MALIRGNVDLLMKLTGALATAGIELIDENATSAARRARRASESPAGMTAVCWHCRRAAAFVADCGADRRAGHAQRPRAAF